MKRLHLIRHAKSSWQDATLTDHQRPLKGRGRKDAALMAPAMVEAGWLASTLHCSTAARAVETLGLLQDKRQVHYHDALYTFSASDLTAWLRCRQEPDITLVGHNPALHELHEWLSGDCLVNFPTCAYSQMTLAIPEWEDLETGCARVVIHITPRMLKG